MTDNIQRCLGISAGISDEIYKLECLTGFTRHEIEKGCVLLAYLCSEVAGATDRGETFNPASLNAEDVTRKLGILAEEAGNVLQVVQILVQKLHPKAGDNN